MLLWATGAGIVGLLAAYNVAKLGSPVVVVDAVGVAAGLSGKAGGYVPRNCYGIDGPLQSLSHVSFALHVKLAEELDGPRNYSYRRLSTLAVEAPEAAESVAGGLSARARDGDVKRKLGHHLLPPWADGGNIGKVCDSVAGR